jgi:hypothetical protein
MAEQEASREQAIPNAYIERLGRLLDRIPRLIRLGKVELNRLYYREHKMLGD